MNNAFLPRDTDPQRDWSEDYSSENGQYQNVCQHCNKLFMGDRHRMTCKKCSSILYRPEPFPLGKSIGWLLLVAGLVGLGYLLFHT